MGAGKERGFAKTDKGFPSSEDDLAIPKADDSDE
jgi:hypothetical protein